MPTTQKKSAGKRAAGKRAAPQAKRRSKASGREIKAAPSMPRPVRREVGAVVCLLLAFFSAFGYFHVDAVFITFFCGLLRGLLGYGFWFMPPMLLLASYILAFHRGRPVRLRVTCALLLPAVAGSLLHILISNYAPGAGISTLAMGRQLWASGEALTSGGLLSGLAAYGCVRAFSKVGAALVFLVAAALMGLTACNRTVVDVADAVRNHPRAEYEREEEPRPARAASKAGAPARRRTADIDIPVDEGPLVGKQPAAPAAGLFEGLTKRGSFFNRKSQVRPPHELLAEEPPDRETPPPDAPPEPPSPQPIPSPAPRVVPQPAAQPSPELAPVPAPAMPEIQREPAVEPRPKAKAPAAETRQAAAEVSRNIEKKLEEGTPVYQYPPLSLLVEGEGVTGVGAANELRVNQERLADTIRSFGIEAKIAAVTRGPSVTRYEVELDQGVRLSKLTNLSDDIALALGATGVRIAPIPDKISMVGIEVPNKLVSPVYIRDVVGSEAFRGHASRVAFAVGKDISGNCVVGNIAKLPHLLIAGTTGSGKSVCINSLIVSLLYKATPEEVRLIMVDPKMVELGIYNGIPHLLIPVVTDPKKAAGALQWAVTEMMKRYRAFSDLGVRDLASYNTHAARIEDMETIPQVVVVIDELADLMLVAAKEVEESICRVAQMGRAAGMHLIIATQRPSADVITGLMKANIPSRIAFAVASAMESRIILDTQGAEKLVGRGDMLYFPLGFGKPLRVQGCLISDEEVAEVVDFVKKSGAADYNEEVIHEIELHAAEKDKDSKGVGGVREEAGDYDELLPNAIEVVVETGQASVSMLQRRLKLGYSRAARLVDQMEEKGIVGPFEGSKPRQLLITKDQWQEMQLRQSMTPSAPVPPEPAPAEEEDEPPFDTEK